MSLRAAQPSVGTMECTPLTTSLSNHLVPAVKIKGLPESGISLSAILVYSAVLVYSKARTNRGRYELYTEVLHASLHREPGVPSPQGFLGERIAYEGEVCYSKLLVVCALL